MKLSTCVDIDSYFTSSGVKSTPQHVSVFLKCSVQIFGTISASGCTGQRQTSLECLYNGKDELPPDNVCTIVVQFYYFLSLSSWSSFSFFLLFGLKLSTASFTALSFGSTPFKPASTELTYPES